MPVPIHHILGPLPRPLHPSTLPLNANVLLPCIFLYKQKKKRVYYMYIYTTITAPKSSVEIHIYKSIISL